MSERKMNKKLVRKKIGRRIAVFVALVTAGQLYAFNHYNGILTNSFHVKTSVGQQMKPLAVDTQKEIAALVQQYPVSAVSDDNTSFAFVDNQNVLHLKDLVHGTVLATVTNSYPVQYLKWIRNDLVFVGEQEAPGVLLLKTVDAGSGTERIIHSFSGLNATDSFKKITYSALTNDVYILIGSNTDSVVYHYDTNSNLNLVYLGGRYIKNIEVTQTGNNLYFEDYAAGTFNVLCRSQGVVYLVNRNSALVSVQDDTLYYGSINQSGLVNAVYKYDNTAGTGVLVATLQNPAMANRIQITSDGQVQVKSSST